MERNDRTGMKIILTKEAKLFAKSLRSGEIIEITDHLYFFEEEGIRSLCGEDMFGGRWEIWVEMPADIVFRSNGLSLTHDSNL